MTFEDIVSIRDEDERMEAFRSFNDVNNLKSYQKMNFISSLRNEEHIIEFLSNDLAFDVDVFIYGLSKAFSKEFNNRIATDTGLEWLRNRIGKMNLSENDVISIIDAYNGDKISLNLFDKSKPYYNEYENIILRRTNFSYDRDVVNQIMDIEKIGKKDRDYINSQVKKLFNLNDEILETVDFKILTQKYSRLGEKLTVITMYPHIQEKILKLKSKEFNFLCDAIDYLNGQHMDWIPIVDDLLTNMGDYSSIINNDISFSSTIRSIKNSAQFNKVLTVMTEKNKYGFSSIKEILNSDRGSRINNTLDENFFKLTDTDKYRNLIFEKMFGQDIKTAERFYECYGQDCEKVLEVTNQTDSEIGDYLTRVRKLHPNSEPYRRELEYAKESNQIISSYLKVYKKIFECDSIQELKSFYNSLDESNEMNIPKSVLDTTFRRFFARLRNEKLYLPKEEDKINVDGEEAYLMTGDYCYQLSSLEAYSKSNSEGIKTQDWNSKKIRNHIICTVFGGKKNMSLPPIAGLCYGFGGYEERALLKSAPYDLGSWAFSNKFEAYRIDDYFKSKFITPDTLLSEIVRRHGEDDLERKSYNYENDAIFKLQPSYTISFVEPELSKYLNRNISSNEVLTAEVLRNLVDYNKMDDMTYRQNIISQELSKDSKWNKTVSDAKEKGIKKTIVDRTHDLIEERLEMDQKETEFLGYTNESLNDPNNMNRFLQLIQEIIVDFERCRSGNIQREILGWDENGASIYGDILHKEIYETLFSYKVMDDKLGKMEAKFNTLDPDKYRMCMQKMKEVSKKQVDKLETQYWWYEYDTGHDWYDYYKYASRKLCGINYENEKSVIEDLLDQNVEGTSMCGGEAVKKVIKEIEQLREYDIEDGNPDWHGRRHINNVTLFSYLIAKREGKIGSNMDLVLQAAKYHDVGRDGVWNGLGPGKRHDKDLVPHAYPSALAAEFYMKKDVNPDGSRKYTDAQIAMVKVAIAYHEVNEKNKNQFNNEVFLGLCKREHVRKEDLVDAKLLCVYLKDADALDRTRFFYEDKNTMFYTDYADNLDLRYLRTNEAIALRDYAREINNIHYANRSGNLYIPKELDKYNAQPEPAKDWDLTKSEIRAFLSNRSIKGDLPGLTQEDMKSIIKVPQEKGIFAKIRKTFREWLRRCRDQKNKSKVVNSR